MSKAWGDLRDWHGWAGLAVLAAFVVMTYLPVLDAPFVYDDFPNIVMNPNAHPDSWSDLVAAMDGAGRQDRPVARLTFGLNYLAHQLDPAGYRAVNVAVHAGAAMVLCLLVIRLAGAPRAPPIERERLWYLGLAVALIWALHPVQTQAVTYIVQRMTSLGGFFYLGVVLVFVQWRLGRLRTPWAIPFMLGLWALALGSKPHTVTAPAVLLVLEIAFFSGWTRRNLVLMGVLGLGGVAAASAYFHDKPLYLLSPHPQQGFSVVERLLTEPRVLWHYASLLVWPDADRLQVNYNYLISEGLLDPPVTALASAALVGFTGLALKFLTRFPWLASGWLCWLIAHSVEGSFILLAPAFEHRIYLPSAFLIAGVVAEVFRYLPRRTAGVHLTLGILLAAALLGFQTMARNAFWSDQEALWGHDIDRGVIPEGIGRNAALAALQKGYPGRALQQLKGVTAEDRETQARLRLIRAQALYLLERYEAAQENLERVLAEYPRTASAQYLLVLVHLGRGDIDSAEQLVSEMREQNADSQYVALASGELALDAEQPERAVDVLRTWLDSHPQASTPSRNMVRTELANALAMAGDPEAARELYREIVRIDPQAWTAWRRLAELLQAGGSEDEARTIREFLREQGVSPGA